MAVNKSKKKLWLQSLLSRYRIIFINETTFNEEYSFRLSRFRIIIISSMIISFFFVGGFLLVAYTPLKEFIPGYTSTKLRKEAIRNTFLLDSLSNEFRKQDQLIGAIKKAFIGEDYTEKIGFKNLSTNNLSKINMEISTVTADSLLRLKVQQEDKYNVFPNINKNVEYLLFCPASGKISQPFDVEAKHLAIDIALEKGAPIKSVARGIVIFANWTADTGHVIIIKHDFGLLSAYKHNSSLEKFQGDLVEAGEVIALAGDTGNLSTGYHLHFELWIDGYPVDPSNFIDFSSDL